jgi:molybdate transport system ATP-binding protein
MSSMSSHGEAGLYFEVEQAAPMALSGTLHCEGGELLAVVGPSGAGKTSLLRVMAGLMRPQQGKVVVDQEVWCDTSQDVFLPPQRRHVGMVFQNYALMPHLSALDNVALSLLHLLTAQRYREARHWLHHVGLNEKLQARRPSALSGGQQQRVAVARALARQPKLLSLDEPFSAVDQISRQDLYRLIADLRSDLSIPMILVTHDLIESRLLADRMLVMDAGTMLQSGTPAEIYNSPRNARVADFVGIQNRFQGEWLGPSEIPEYGLLRWVGEVPGVVDTPLLTVRDKERLKEGQRLSWIIPGDAISLVDTATAQAGDFTAQITSARHLGEITMITVALVSMPGVKLAMTVSGAQRHDLKVGDRVSVRIDQKLVHVMPHRID